MSELTAKNTVFYGPEGLRAGWGILLFAALVAIFLSAVHWTLGRWGHGRMLRAGGPVDGTLPLPVGLGEAVLLLAVLFATAVMARMERRPLLTYGLGGVHRLRYFVVGLLCGFGFLSLLMGVLVVTHHVRLDMPTLPSHVLWRYAGEWGCVFLLVGLFEELSFRGYVLFTLARGIGFWPASLLLAVLFGAVHKGNPGEGPLGLGMAAGVALLFSFSLWRTGSLWWAIGFHAAWDWAESYFYGTADSGTFSSGRLMTAHPSGAAWLGGGATGPEGSIWCGVVLLLAVLWVWMTQRESHVGRQTGGPALSQDHSRR